MRRRGRTKSVPVDLIVEFNGRGEAIRLTSVSVRDPNRVAEGFLKTFGEVPEELEDISKRDWRKFVINTLKAENKLEFKEIEESEEKLVVEIILNAIRRSRITTDKLEALIAEDCIFYDGEALVVPSRRIRSLLQAEGFTGFSGKTLHDLLGKYTKKKTGPVRFDSETVLWSWFFDPEKIAVNVEERLKEAEEVFNE